MSYGSVRIVGLCLLLISVLVLSACQPPLYHKSGLAIRVPRGWEVREIEAEGEAQVSPVVMVSHDEHHMLMLWTRTNEEAPVNESDSRRLRWFAARYASWANAPLNSWSVPEPLHIEDVLAARPVRDAKQVYVVSAASPAGEACIAVFSYRSPLPPPKARNVAHEILHALCLSDKVQPFERMDRKATRTTPLKSPVSELTLNVDGDEIIVPKGWVPEDLLLIGSPGGYYDKSANRATVYLAFTERESKRVPSITLSWARGRRAGQDIHQFAASLTQFLTRARTAAGMRRTEVTHAHSTKARLWRFQRFEGEASRPLVQWICITDTLAFQASTLSNDKVSMSKQEKAVLAVLEQLLDSR